MTHSTGFVVNISPCEVHVWLVAPHEVRAPRLLRAYRELLDEREAERQERLVREDDRHTDLVTRALIRITLSRYVDRHPKTWAFVRTQHGRPELAEGQCPLPLRFNLSHTSGLVACAVTLERDIGVDVEMMQGEYDIIPIATQFFGENEVAALRGLPEGQRRERFFQYWTLKEACLKAMGQGLCADLKQIVFDIDGSGQHIRFMTRASMRDGPARWTFELARPTREHTLALAISQAIIDEEIKIHYRFTLPKP